MIDIKVIPKTSNKDLPHFILLLKDIDLNMPRIVKLVLREIARASVRKAQSYIRGTRKPKPFSGGPGGSIPWTPLYNIGPKMGESTMLWNKTSRKSKTGSSHPLSDEGGLEKSLKFWDLKYGTHSASVKVGILDSHYAKVGLKQEYGGSNPLKGHKRIPSRPFLFPAIMDVKNDPRLKSKIKNRITRMLEASRQTGAIKISEDMFEGIGEE